MYRFVHQKNPIKQQQYRGRPDHAAAKLYKRVSCTLRILSVSFPHSLYLTTVNPDTRRNARIRICRSLSFVTSTGSPCASSSMSYNITVRVFQTNPDVFFRL